MPWNPDAYEKFKTERAAPFTDMLMLINPRENLDVIDLGCGTGSLTRQLADALPNSNVLGIDSSAEMLAQANQYMRPGLRFEQKPIQEIQGQWDLVFSHAAIQWIPDHHQLLPRFWSMVRIGGQIAIHVPSNQNHYSHRAILETAAEEPFVTALNHWHRDTPVLPADQYAEILFDCGATDITAFEKIYPAVLNDSDQMSEWTASTTLIPYIERLPETLREPFMDRYRAKLRARWPQGPIFYAYQRTIFVATRER
jgi:trans-aconitate 2-methyltransferase